MTERKAVMRREVSSVCFPGGFSAVSRLAGC